MAPKETTTVEKFDRLLGAMARDEKKPLPDKKRPKPEKEKPAE